MRRNLHGWVVLLSGCVGLPPAPPGDVPESTSTTASAATSTGAADETTAGQTSIGSSEGGPVDTTASSNGWRREIVVEGHPLGPVADVPVRVHLDAGSLGLPTEPEGLSFVDGDGLSPLPFEIESWDEQAAEIWVLVPEVTTVPRTIWMDYERADPPTPRPPEEVWGDALGVWHMHAGMLDSSSRGNNGIDEASPGPGRIAEGHTYAGLEVDHLPPVGNTVAGTVQMWFRARPDQPGTRFFGQAIFFHGSPQRAADGDGAHELYVSLRLREVGHDVDARCFGGENQGSMTLRHRGDWLDDQWHHVTVTWEDAEQEQAVLYVDGEPYATDTSLPPTFDFSAFVRLGGVPGQFERSFAGELDEVRLHDVALEPARASVEYAAQTEEFVTVGPAMPID